MADEAVYGFIIIDGSSVMMATIQGDQKTIHVRYQVDLPKKHNKGGQSAQRFGRIYQEKRQNFVTKVSEMVTSTFITGSKPNVKALILAGCAEFKQKLLDSMTFDMRLKPIVAAVLDVAYGMENGLSEAISKSSAILDNVQLVQEKQYVESLFNEIARDTGKYVFGLKETMEALELGYVDKLLIHSEYQGCLYDEDGTVKYSLVERADATPILDYLLETPTAAERLLTISDRTSEGSQFVRGFGGIAAILHYCVGQDPHIPSTTYVTVDEPIDEPLRNGYEEFDFM